MEETDTSSHTSQIANGEHISAEKVGKNISVEWYKIDYSTEGYGTADAWKREYEGFIDETYVALEARSSGVTLKEFKNYMKKETKKEFGIKGKKKRR